jgi:hypothetical protein
MKKPSESNQGTFLPQGLATPFYLLCELAHTGASHLEAKYVCRMA